MEDSYILQELGRGGEPKADRPISLRFSHGEFKNTVGFSLKTDELGRVQLGELQDITHIQASNAEGASTSWSLPTSRYSLPSTIHTKEGEDIELAYSGTNTRPERNELSLLELRQGTFNQGSVQFCEAQGWDASDSRPQARRLQPLPQAPIQRYQDPSFGWQAGRELHPVRFTNPATVHSQSRFMSRELKKQPRSW